MHKVLTPGSDPISYKIIRLAEPGIRVNIHRTPLKKKKTIRIRPLNQKRIRIRPIKITARDLSYLNI